MSGPDATIATRLANLEERTLDEIRELSRDRQSPYVVELFAQVVRPRANLGGTGPPGRAD